MTPVVVNSRLLVPISIYYYHVLFNYTRNSLNSHTVIESCVTVNTGVLFSPVPALIFVLPFAIARNHSFFEWHLESP
jgi:hypothetical protein